LPKNVYVMKDVTFTKLVNRFGVLFCPFCGEPICVGDLVLSYSYCSRVKVYHKVCFDKLYLDF